jgi:hypothetical protein
MNSNKSATVWHLFIILSLFLNFSCQKKNDYHRLKLWPSIDDKNLVLRQYDNNKFFVIDHINNKVLLTHFEKDSLLNDATFSAETEIVDVAVNSENIVYFDNVSFTVHDLNKKSKDKIYYFEEDTITFPYSFHKFFNARLIDSFLYVQNYCIACANNPKSGISYKLERRYNINTGIGELIEATPPYISKKYFLKSENFISRVNSGHYIFYSFLNYPNFLRYNILTKKTDELKIKEKIIRPIYLTDTSEFVEDYFSYVMDFTSYNTSNQGLFFDSYDSMLYNFKFLGLPIDSVNSRRNIILQKINIQGVVINEYTFQDSDWYNLIFINKNVYIEKIIKKANKTERYFEKINI